MKTMRLDSRAVRTNTEYLRGEAPNTRTRVLGVEGDSEGESERRRAEGGTRVDFEYLFCRRWHSISRALDSFQEPGVVVAAVHADSRHVSTVCLGSKRRIVNAAIVGRHAHAEVFLAEDDTVSLRHLAILAHPLGSGRPRFSLLDLRTESAFRDEHGRRLEAITFTGPVFVSCGSYALFFFPTRAPRQPPENESRQWDADRHCFPSHGRSAWDDIPPRIYGMSDLGAFSEQWPPVKEVSLLQDGSQTGEGAPVTHVQCGPGPAAAALRKCLREDEQPTGLFHLATTPEAPTATILLGPTALRQGVLIGRYSRCATDGLDDLVDDSVSRVHLLAISLGGDVYAIDTASTNGVKVNGVPQHVIKLEFGHRLQLGTRLLQLEWRAVG